MPSLENLDSLPFSPEQIEDILARSGANIEWATGFFSALHAGPDLVEPSKWLPEFTPEDGFVDNEEATSTFAVLLGLYGRVGKACARNPAAVCPDPADVESVEAWCSGYFGGSRLHPRWKDDETALIAACVLGMLGGELPTDGIEDPDGTPMRDVEGWLESQRHELRDHVRGLWEHWAPARRTAAVVARDKRNVGRNDPCPCGSGKKYKKCCLV